MKGAGKEKVFLLGGYDLEMLTIKQLLEARTDCVVIDKRLSWDNAFLSAYREELSLYNDKSVYAVELQDDLGGQYQVTFIDHHNGMESNPSSLEQVAAVLDASLNRFQQLVAANDKGYIPGMMAMSATREEIDEVRRNDRKAQGVSEEEEKLAELSIASRLTHHGHLIVVRSLTPRFSCICDRLFPYHSLLVYDDASWAFYGEGKTELTKCFSADITLKKVYYGGGDFGFIGSVKCAYSREEIIHFVEQMKCLYEQN